MNSPVIYVYQTLDIFSKQIKQNVESGSQLLKLDIVKRVTPTLS